MLPETAGRPGLGGGAFVGASSLRSFTGTLPSRLLAQRPTAQEKCPEQLWGLEAGLAAASFRLSPQAGSKPSPGSHGPGTSGLAALSRSQSRLEAVLKGRASNNGSKKDPVRNWKRSGPKEPRDEASQQHSPAQPSKAFFPSSVCAGARPLGSSLQPQENGN